MRTGPPLGLPAGPNFIMGPMKLLVVEDEIPMGSFLRKGLVEEGYAVDWVVNGPAADEAFTVSEYDLAILDVSIPGQNGFELCRRWRASGHATPILFVTARDDTASKVRGLDLGGDDYLTKPFEFAELLARVRALLRRPAAERSDSMIRIGDLRIDTASHKVIRGEQSIILTPKEYRLLEQLANEPGRVLSRTALWEHLWATGSEPDSNVVDVYIGYLRAKLGRTPDLIETVRGFGYRLKVEED
jgi:two-component system OmpR family response regulator